MRTSDLHRDLIPPLLPEERDALEASIIDDGCRDPLVVWEEEDLLLDGHNRLDICEQHGIGFRVVKKSLPGPRAAQLWIIRNQMGRRNLSTHSRVVVALKAEHLLKLEAEKRKGGRPKKGVPTSAQVSQPRVDQQIATIARVGKDTVQKVRKLERFASPTVKAALHAGTMTINAAHAELSKSKRKPKKPPAACAEQHGKCPHCPEWKGEQ